MRIQVTEQDIRAAKRNGVDNPLTLALRRVVGNEWFVLDGHRQEVALYQLSPPYRAIVLPSRVVNVLRAWKDSEIIQPFEVELDLQRSH
jgi:hypothetical protein